MLVAADMTEAEFQEAVIELARWAGWQVYHARPSQIRPGVWATAFTGDPGFPDLLLAHPERGVLFAELKSERGVASTGQLQWLWTLRQAGAEAYLWRPRDMDTIVARLQGLPA